MEVEKKDKVLIFLAVFIIVLFIIVKGCELGTKSNLPKDKDCYVGMEVFKGSEKSETEYQKLDVKCAVKDDCRDFLVSQGVAEKEARKIRVKCE